VGGERLAPAGAESGAALLQELRQTGIHPRNPRGEADALDQGGPTLNASAPLRRRIVKLRVGVYIGDHLVANPLLDPFIEVDAVEEGVVGAQPEGNLDVPESSATPRSPKAASQNN